ncbi:hypothetical protein NLI96_g12552 [Meripilus lineatus]|uniref:Uncharacterized protein n=1 Tax=Meripilus lineatus TaxID=2056292 RepID=A0AAD5UPQ3_9APHY|nr:hypothetical protein NLI96_g12552 [Physisporinus lineatus]
MMTEDFLNLMEGVDKDDKEEQDCRMKDVYDEVELWEKDPAKSIPFATTRIKQAIRQFTGLAQAYCGLEDIEIGGFVTYLRTDSRVKVLSSFWGGSDIIKKAIVKYEPNLDELMNIMVTIFNAIRYSEKGIDIDLPKMIQKIPHPNADHSRDDLRGLVSEVMHRKLEETVGEGKGIPMTFQWSNWLDVAYKFKVRINNWPATLRESVPGYGCNRKGWSHSDLDLLLSGGVKIEEWTPAERKLSYLKAKDIPLVVDSDSVVIRRLIKSRNFIKDHTKKSKKKRAKSKKGKEKATTELSDNSHSDFEDNPDGSDNSNNDDIAQAEPPPKAASFR